MPVGMKCIRIIEKENMNMMNDKNVLYLQSKG